MRDRPVEVPSQDGKPPEKRRRIPRKFRWLGVRGDRPGSRSGELELRSRRRSSPAPARAEPELRSQATASGSPRPGQPELRSQAEERPAPRSAEPELREPGHRPGSPLGRAGAEKPGDRPGSPLGRAGAEKPGDRPGSPLGRAGAEKPGHRPGSPLGRAGAEKPGDRPGSPLGRPPRVPDRPYEPGTEVPDSPEAREHNRISGAPRNRQQAEAAAHILWRDAQWLRSPTVSSQYVGLQYARIALQDIRAIIMDPGAFSPDQKRQLIRSKIAIATSHLRERLLEAGVDSRNVEQLQESIEQRLEELELAYPVNNDDVREIEHGIDDLLTKIDNYLRASDHRSLGEEAKVLIRQTSDLAEDVALTLAGVANVVAPIPPSNDFARTAVIATLVTSLLALQAPHPGALESTKCGTFSD